MSDTILNALVHLFALVASVNVEALSERGRNIVRAYLKRYLNDELTREYLKLFDDYRGFYYREIHSDQTENLEGSPSLISFQSLNVCHQVKKGLNREDRITVFMQLLEFVNEDAMVTPRESEIIEVVASSFNIDENEFRNLKEFVLTNSLENIEAKNVLIMDNQIREWAETVSWFMKKEQKDKDEFKYFYKENLYGELIFLYIYSIRDYVFKYIGEQNLYLEGYKIQSGRVYFLRSGAIIKGPNIDPVYYNDISKKFFIGQTFPEIVFSGNEIEFTFGNSQNGIKKFNFCEESGNIIGILGGSGVGKSTLLSLINGKLRPDNGQILINGFDIYKHRFKLQGMIGLVPQDDLLIEELTVYQNLYYNARLCLADYSKNQLEESIEKILEDLDLSDIAHLRVGNPLNKFISGGQRKRLNIGLELMREPYILILDEPTSGLSSSDSENIMQLLRNQARRGRIVVATIHQPSSKIFKMLDKLWILDKGGYPVYSGNPVDAVIYFKKINAQVNAAESECPSCGNINTEQILNIIEARTLDDAGSPTKSRKISPQLWFDYYKDKIESSLKRKEPSKKIPESNFKLPSSTSQFRTFSIRNLLAKISNTQYLVINLLEAPILALILGYFTKYVQDEVYLFQDNKSFPVFIFMAVVVALFMGLTVSAEEIVRDRKILERESFLNLSWPAYLSSKIVFLFVLSAIQTLSFVVIGNWILDIKEMFLIYWLILFSVSAFGNMIGLNISSGLDSVVAIYVLIPLILVPQLLLGGAMIPFDDLNKGLTNKKYVPVVGDLMITRWAYEALTVEQFKSNEFEKYFFKNDGIISTSNYYNTFLIPDLQLKLQRCQRMFDEEIIDREVLENDLTIVRNELNKMTTFQNVTPWAHTDRLTPDSVNIEILEATLGYLMFIKLHFTDLGVEALARKDFIYDSLRLLLGEEELLEFQQKYYNNKLADLVMNRNEIRKIYQAENELIRKFDPIFIMPENKFGRAQFFAPYKLLNHQVVDTVWFNLVVIWIGSIMLYFTLIFDILRRIMIYFRNVLLAKKSIRSQ